MAHVHSHNSSIIPGQPRDELQREEEKESPVLVSIVITSLREEEVCRFAGRLTLFE